MARKQKITREVVSTEVEVMVCDTENGGITFEYDTFVGKTTNKKAMKVAKENHEKDGKVVVKVTLAEKHDKYSMDLETFVKNATLETANPAEAENE